MPLIIDPNLVELLREQSGAMHFQLADHGLDAPRTIAAMQSAINALWEIRHPDEPDEALASFMSEIKVNPDDGRVAFWADISDVEEEPLILKQIVEAVAGALVGASIDSGILSSPPASERNDMPTWLSGA